MLDTAGYLSSFGWQGQGNGLRQGSVSRPLAIPQKRTLSGLGKDRDDAFPFWDHLFAAASKSIKIKVSGDEETDGDATLTPSSLLRTTTGILSNRRPVSGTPASSGSVTPIDQAVPRLSLMAIAKRESARKRLYAGFFKGPVLGPEVDPRPETQSTPIAPDTEALKVGNTNGQIKDRKRKHENQETRSDEKKPKKSKKSKHKETCIIVAMTKERIKKKHRDAESQAKPEEKEVSQIPLMKDHTETPEERRQRKAAKLERRKRKEERRKAKGLKGMTSDVRGDPV